MQVMFLYLKNRSLITVTAKQDRGIDALKKKQEKTRLIFFFGGEFQSDVQEINLLILTECI